MFLSCGRLNNIRITYESHTNNICVTAANELQKQGFFRALRTIGTIETIGTIRKEGWISRTPDCWIA